MPTLVRTPRNTILYGLSYRLQFKINSVSNLRTNKNSTVSVDFSMPRKSSSTSVSDVALEVEKTIHSVAPSLKRVIKYGAPTFQGQGDVITIGVWSKFIAVGFWNGAKLASRYPLLEGSGRTSRIAKLRTLSEAKSKTFRDLIKAAAKLDVTDPVHRK